MFIFFTINQSHSNGLYRNRIFGVNIRHMTRAKLFQLPCKRHFTSLQRTTYIYYLQSQVFYLFISFLQSTHRKCPWWNQWNQSHIYVTFDIACSLKMNYCLVNCFCFWWQYCSYLGPCGEIQKSIIQETISCQLSPSRDNK